MNRPIYSRLQSALGAAAVALLVASIRYHERRLVVLATVLLTICLVLAFRRHPNFEQRLAILSLALASLNAWSHKETFWAILLTATFAYGAIRSFRYARFQRQRHADAQQWPLAKGHWATSGGDAIYAYQANGGYFSGAFPISPTLGLNSRLKNLQGKPALVRYKPDQPEISAVLKSDQIEPLP